MFVPPSTKKEEEADAEEEEVFMVAEALKSTTTETTVTQKEKKTAPKDARPALRPKPPGYKNRILRNKNTATAPQKPNLKPTTTPQQDVNESSSDMSDDESSASWEEIANDENNPVKAAFVANTVQQPLTA